MNPVGPADIRRANAITGLQALRDAGAALSISEICQRTQLSRPTVDAVIGDFEARGVIIAAPTDESGAAGGRPARRYVINPSNALVAGIDAGPRNIRVLLADLQGNVVSRTQSAITGEPNAHERLKFVGDTVQRALEESGVPADRLRGACVAVSGIISADGILADSIAVPEWAGADIAGAIADRFGCDTLLENDIKLAAFAEHHMGAAQDVDSILYTQIGNRVSLAMTFDGQIFQGARRSSGEVGSLRGMRWASNAVKGQLTWTSGASAEEVFARALAGDKDALAEVRVFTAEIAPLITTASLVLDPALVVVGGGLSQAGDLLVSLLRDEIHRLIVLDAKPDVAASPLGSIGTALGALALAFQTWSEPLFGIVGVPVPAIDIAEAIGVHE